MSKLLLVLVVFAALVVIAFSPNPISDAIQMAASASYSEDAPASVQALQISPRVETCGAGGRQGLINQMNMDANAATGVVDGLTIGQWLDNQMWVSACITPAE